jgi:hypothetical protein
MSIQSWKWRNIDSTCRFIIFSGNYSARSSQNALQWVNCRDWIRFPDPLWRHPSYGHIWVKSVVRAISTSDGNARMPSGHSRKTELLLFICALAGIEWPRNDPSRPVLTAWPAGQTKCCVASSPPHLYHKWLYLEFNSLSFALGFESIGPQNMPKRNGSKNVKKVSTVLRLLMKGLANRNLRLTSYIDHCGWVLEKITKYFANPTIYLIKSHESMRLIL